MIKINLLAVDRERAKRQAKFQIGQKVTVGCSLIPVATALLMGWWYWSLQGAFAELDRQIAVAQRETVRLHSAIQQVRQFEARGAQLQQRVTLIQQLSEGQSGPVHMLDAVSRSLPDTMWLLELKQTGSDILIDGRTATLTSLPDFISSLEGSSVFAPPVEIVDSKVEPAAAGTPEVIRFSVKARFIPLAN